MLNSIITLTFPNESYGFILPRSNQTVTLQLLHHFHFCTFFNNLTQNNSILTCLSDVVLFTGIQQAHQTPGSPQVNEDLSTSACGIVFPYCTNSSSFCCCFTTFCLSLISQFMSIVQCCLKEPFIYFGYRCHKVVSNS